jgi:hypothetical protein
VRPRVGLRRRPLWRIRLQRELPRWLLCAAAAAGLIASARDAIDPSQPVFPPAVSTDLATDPAAAGYAVLFARRLLTWQAGETAASAEGLEGFTAAGAEPSAAFQPPSTGSQGVRWAEVVQMREPSAGVRVYTVAAETDSDGLAYVAVPVERTAAGLRLAGYPAFVGPPAQAPAGPGAHLREVSDPALQSVALRALRNYLSGSGNELAADLARGAQVTLPEHALTLESLQRLAWSPDGRSVVAVVEAQDARGAQYELQYELDVVDAQGRWEVGAVETNPYE